MPSTVPSSPRVGLIRGGHSAFNCSLRGANSTIIRGDSVLCSNSTVARGGNSAFNSSLERVLDPHQEWQQRPQMLLQVCVSSLTLWVPNL